MSFSGKDELNREAWIGEQPHQPLGIVKEEIGAFIGGKTARKPEGQHFSVEDAGSLRWIRAFCGKLALIPLAHMLNEVLSFRRAHLP